MISVKSISGRLLKSNRVLTISCILSVLIGTMLIIEMFNLSVSSTRLYEKDMKSLYGNCDAAVYYSEYEEIDQDKVEEIVNLDSVEEAATLFYSGNVDINGASVYAIGTDNSDMVRSRYHFEDTLDDGEIAINEVFARVYGYEEGSILQVMGRELYVREIFDDETLSAASIEMLVANKKTLKEISPLVGDTNIVMLQVPNVDDSHIASDLRKIDDNLQVMIFGTDEEYLSNVNSFKVFLLFVCICVVIVTALFTATVFRNFMYKYRRDMAVLRMTGATQAQINTIFHNMIMIIISLGVVGGYFSALLINTFLMDGLNQKLGLVEGSILFLYKESLLIAVVVFLALLVILKVSIRKMNRILPMEALAINEKEMSGKMEKTRRIGFSIFRKDLYISMQLIRSRLKENRLMIATISMLVAITILGANLSAIIKANGEKYYRELYLTEFVLTTSQTMSFEEGEKLYEDLQGAVSGPVSELYQASYPVTIGAESFQYGLADINALGRSEIIENKNYEADAIIVSKSFAKNIGCEEGDRIRVTSPEIIARDADGNPLDSVEKEGKEFSFQVGFIGEDDLMQGNDLLIDTSQMDFVNDSVWLGSIYLDGDNEEIQDELSELKGKYPVIKWASYTDAIKTSEQKVNSRFSVLDVVVKILVLVAAIGWIHSLQNILVSRGRDYSIIRMLGVKRSRIAKILIYQIAIYILAGVLGGVLLGTVLLELFMCLEEHRLVFHLEYMGVVWVIGLMLTFCVLLLPAINKICRRSIAEE